MAKARIFFWGKSAIDPKVRVPEFWSVAEFHSTLLNKFVVVEKETTTATGTKIDRKRVPLSRWWLEKKDRYIHNGIIFDSKAEEVSEADEINLWRGFAVEPVEGDWSLMRDHIRNVIANEEEKSADYIMRWLAWAIQNPTDPAETAIALGGGQGTGKGILGRSMRRAFGPHGLHISNSGLLTGRFNAHFMQTSFLFADEAIWPGRRDDEGALKRLVTEDTLAIEPKGVDTFAVPNCLKLFMASNADWIVPAGIDDRRFAVFQVSEERKQDSQYFGRLQRQLDNGGLAAMLYHFQNWDLEGWHPRNNIPQTAIRQEQQERTMPPELKWLAGYLESGVLDWQHPKRSNWVEAGAFYEHARKAVQGLRFWTDIDFARFLDKWSIVQRRSNGSWRAFPPLTELRAEWKRRFPTAREFDPKISEWKHGER
ncbi:MAG: primase-helicase family protein [Pseudorhodoplanes sp.]